MNEILGWVVLAICIIICGRMLVIMRRWSYERDASRVHGKIDAIICPPSTSSLNEVSVEELDEFAQDIISIVEKQTPQWDMARAKE